MVDNKDFVILVFMDREYRLEQIGKLEYAAKKI